MLPEGHCQTNQKEQKTVLERVVWSFGQNLSWVLAD